MAAVKKIWIDFENSPHVLFFRPIIDELSKAGFSIFITARDCFQVCQLADMYGMEYTRIGRHYGKNKALKVFGLFYRVTQLLPRVLAEKPDLALSHGSRTLFTLASMLGIRSVNIVDYEHTKDLPFFRPDFLMTPDVIPDDAISFPKDRVLKYPGIKEDVYTHYLEPDGGILDTLGLSENDIIVTVRPPAYHAHYHTEKSETLFIHSVNYLSSIDGLRLVVLPRDEKQKKKIIEMWPELVAGKRIIIPNHVVDGLNLLWHSDFAISGGGTMNREAAALGVPVYSIFCGKTGSVDEYLSRSGRLVILKGEQDLDKIVVSKRAKGSLKPTTGNSDALNSIIKTVHEMLAFE